jgi:hypothetical protein
MVPPGGGYGYPGAQGDPWAPYGGGGAPAPGYGGGPSHGGAPETELAGDPERTKAVREVAGKISDHFTSALKETPTTDQIKRTRDSATAFSDRLTAKSLFRARTGAESAAGTDDDGPGPVRNALKSKFRALNPLPAEGLAKRFPMSK